MNQQIQNDLDAQKTSKANALTYYQLNQQHELNRAKMALNAAEIKNVQADLAIKADTHAKNQMLLGALHTLQLGTDKLPQGQQKANSQAVLSQVGTAVGQEIQQNNLKGALAMANNPQGQFQVEQKALRTATMLGLEGGSEMARANEEHHVNGFTPSDNPVPQEVRSELIAKKEYDQAAKNYIDFAKKHQKNWANLNPKQRMEIAKQGAVLGAELQGKYRLKTHGGVYKEGEQHFIRTIIPDNAVSWAASFNQIPAVEQTIKNNKMDIENLANGYNMKPIWDGERSSSSSQSEKATPAEGATKMYNGKMYRRGPHGEAIEVK
jgi:hypothetical protein